MQIKTKMKYYYIPIKFTRITYDYIASTNLEDKVNSFDQAVYHFLMESKLHSRLQKQVCLHAAMLPFMIMMDWISETVSKLPN